MPLLLLLLLHITVTVICIRDKLDITYYDSFGEFLDKHSSDSLFFFSQKGKNCYTDVEYGNDVYLVFGKESCGLPEDFLREHLERCVRIPMRESLRSLNLSNSVAIAVYEVLRQSGFRGQQEESDYLSES